MKKNQDFLDLLSAHEGILQKVSRMYTEIRTDREDLRQEIIYQLWKAWPGFRGESKASTWVYRVALNTAISRVRKRKPLIDYLPFMPDRSEPLPEEDGPKERLFAAIRQLPKTDRALIALYFEDLPHAEISRIMGISENAVAARLHRIKTKLKSLLK
jgi:RNA polymerase sigma-70 factor (ECF subfamily)